MQHFLVDRRSVRLLAGQERRAELRAVRAERQRRGHAARIGDPARRDHRDLHRIDDLRHQRERARQRRVRRTA